MVEVDPVIDQTRAITLQLFASDLQSDKLERDPRLAREAWLATAASRRDGGLVRILERLDLETFEHTWHVLMRTLDLRGRSGMIHWLCERKDRE